MAAAAQGGLAAVDLSEPDFSGDLTKRSKWLKQWRKRYFVLKGNRLYFSEGPGKVPHGEIDLKDCLTVKSAEDKTNKRHSFEVATPQEVYFLYADTEKEKDEWIGAIGRAIVRFSSAYTADDGYED
ncbi:Pleckstrin-likey domain-containing protein 1 [Hondaea fermentalgiana]|uniref:Pleckstrin-likey domain-containing protein 1 n=1 Tax=Hondaea fermentalgiana TaxID=2315210 RepID=A0A2R5GJD3_9STRA|nr:Pleckstrin-likey domain-containing protein 1 [Hondaea fermentalgiana]|eukprot:GBG28401.1 Pleckstrin-likey domain-containing protein 1 [Hondaea fermentalgiana]